MTYSHHYIVTLLVYMQIDASGYNCDWLPGADGEESLIPYPQ